MKKIKFEAETVETAIGNAQLENVLPFFSCAFSPRYKVCAKFPGILLFLTALLSFGCESPSLKKVDSNAAAANAQGDVKSSLETDLQTMKNANFDYIYVFRRKDGGALDGEDKKYLKANSPVFTNRFILTDENKAVVAGSSYKFEPENLDNLQKRFVTENFSKPENQETPKNSNSND